MNKKTKRWYDYMWIWSIAFFVLGFFNILFAWLGMLDFIIPLIFAIVAGNKWFCNNMCGRGQLLSLLGNKCSRKKLAPKWMRSTWFRIGFLIFFLGMFFNMIFQTYLVYSGAGSVKAAIKLFWTFKVPWKWAYAPGMFPAWVYQYSFGFYSLMLTSTLIGLTVMMLYRPRTWCTFCPMGTMTQGICKLRKR